MIDLVCIFTTGGVILFYQAFSTTAKIETIQKLIQNKIATKKDETSVLIDSFRVQYTKSQEHNIIFTIGYQEFFAIKNVDLLLESLKSNYIEQALPNIVKEDNLIQSIPEFRSEFEQVFNLWNQRNKEEQSKKKQAATFYQTKKGQELRKTTQQNDENAKKQAQLQKQNAKLKQRQMRQQQQDGEDGYEEDQQDSNSGDQMDAIERNKQALQKRFSASGKKNSYVSNPSDENLEDQNKKKKKVMRESTSGKVTKRAMDSLNKSVHKGDGDDKKFKDQYLGGENDIIEGFVDSDYESDEEDKAKSKGGFFSKITNQVKVMTGNKNIDEEDLEPVLMSFKDHLAGKNVAEQMAQKICDSIKINMLNTKSAAFTSINKMVKESLEQTLTKILTPKRHIDPIAEALRARERGKPYVITFIGVNGVGKSTNLAKVAYMFKSQGFKIMLAACDNFRAGAVEQIKTHGRCLDVPVYDKGYGQDAADIAFEAIREAQLKKYDVVLIDTAGRMQDNEPLMRQLSKLVVMNNPDLVVFIGEALVGNDGLDQLTKFNKALIDLSPSDNVREIDGIILSKFDTVDDKVGAAITMTYNSGKPILFVGVGQKYTHLKKLNVKTVVKALLD